MGMTLAVTAACSESTPDESAMNRNIVLEATVGELHVSSRAYANAWTASATELKADVWFRKGDGEYGPDPGADETLPVKTSVTFKSDNNWQASVKYKDPNDNNELELNYPTDKLDVCCIGMYPGADPENNIGSKWTTTDNQTFSAEINGDDDLMFAPEISGNWGDRFPKQRYKHLLAWIKINVCAYSHEAIKTWGKIKQISIESYSKVTVKPGATVSVNDDSKINIGEGGQSALCIYEKQDPDGNPDTPDPYWIKTINNEEGFKLESTTLKEVGSVLCFPVRDEKKSTENAEDNKKYYWVKLKIESEGREPQMVYLMLNTITQYTDKDGNIIKEDIKDVEKAEELMGKCFVLSLYFTPYNIVIEGECTLDPWIDQNEDIITSN